MKGLFISFEGNDGCGKTSAIDALFEELKEKGYDVIRTREPGGSPIAEKIRDIILDKANLGMDPITEAYLYAASRREHLQKKILPAIKEGKIVLCDRFIDSSLAYQGYARQIGIDKVYDLNSFAVEESLPDLTLLFDVRPEIGIARIQANRSDMDRLELEEIDFHHRVYEGYKEIYKRFSNRIEIIDGEKTIPEVLKQVEDIIYTFIEEHLK